MKKLNKEGFTLVELLAVIVVLAIIMIIAIPTVLSSMDNAKKGSVVIQARKAYNKALEIEQNKSLGYDSDKGTAITGGGTCYTLDELGISGGNKYTGKVTVVSGTYTVYIKDDSFVVNGVNGTAIQDSSATAVDSSATYNFSC